MILLRILILVGLVALGWIAWRRLTRKPVVERPPESFEPMVPCAICRTHVPRDRAIEHHGEFRCKEHAETDH